MFFKKPQRPPVPALILGTHTVSNQTLPFQVPLAQLTSGLITGKSGYGKSVLMVQMFVQLLMHGTACSLFAPHSDTATGILAYLLSHGYFNRPDAFHRLWYVKWSRRDCYPAFNFLDQPQYDPYTLASHAHEAFTRFYPSTDGTTPLFSSIFLPSVVTLIYNHLSLPMLIPLITDRDVRTKLISTVPDQAIHAMLQRLDNNNQLIQSTLRRLQLLLFHPILRYTLGQQRNIINFRRIIDSGISVIYDLGELDYESQRLLMCLLQLGYESAGLSRSDTPEAQRRPHCLMVDEAAAVVGGSGESFAVQLEQLRKFMVLPVLTVQSFHRLPEPVQLALGNVGMEVAFRAPTEADARVLAHRLTDFSTAAAIKRRGDDTPSRAELQAETALALERLARQQARVRVGDRYATLMTLTMPPAGANSRELIALQDTYARRLGTPAAQAQAEADALVQPVRTYARQQPPEDDHAHYWDTANI